MEGDKALYPQKTKARQIMKIISTLFVVLLRENALGKPPGLGNFPLGGAFLVRKRELPDNMKRSSPG